MNAAFTPRHSAHVSDSTLCATCHNLKTPVLNGTRASSPADEFPEQMVYSEWENSDFADGGAEASTCQQCHMARANGGQDRQPAPFPRPPATTSPATASTAATP